MERYLWAFGGLILTSILMTGNVMAAIAITSPESLSRVIFVSLSVTCDILVIAAQRSLFLSLSSNQMFRVFLAAGAWAFMSCCTCYSCSEWFRGTFSQEDSKQITAKTNVRVIDDKLAKEREHLGAAEQTALNATTQMKREDAKKEAAESRKRIGDLESQRQWPAQMVNAGTVDMFMHGRELPVTIILFALSQICWFFGFGSPCHGGDSPDRYPVSDRSSKHDRSFCQVTPDIKPVNPLPSKPCSPVTVKMSAGQMSLIRGSSVIPFQRPVTIHDMRDRGLSWQEIAQDLRISESTARRRYRSEAQVHVAE